MSRYLEIDIDGNRKLSYSTKGAFNNKLVMAIHILIEIFAIR